MTVSEIGAVGLRRDYTSLVDLESELDRLYEGPAASFVAERNKLAQALRKSGDRPGAETVARLQRPSPVAWAINQLHFRTPKVLEELREAGIALRRAQESGNMEEFAARKEAHQAALAAATERALELSAGSGAAPSAQSKRKIEMTLTVLSTAVEDATPPPGRMTAELESLGFDAFTSVPAAAPVAKASKRAEAPEDSAHTEKIAAVKAALDAADKELRRLEREAERSQAALERAQRDLEDAERRAETARRDENEAQRAAVEARTRVDAARDVLDQAKRAMKEL